MDPRSTLPLCVNFEFEWGEIASCDWWSIRDYFGQAKSLTYGDTSARIGATIRPADGALE